MLIYSLATTSSSSSDIDARALLRRTGVESPPGYTTPAAVTRALRSRAAGGELAELEHEPERQLRRQRQSLNDRLELEGEGRPIVRPIVQEPHEQQIERRGPEAFGEAWIYIEEVVRGIIDQAVPDSESGESGEESEQEEEAQATEGIEAWDAWTMEEGNAG